MSRRTRFALSGALAGAAGAAWVWHLARSAIDAGQNAAGVGFGVSHLLFLVSLPWSVLPLMAGVAASALTGVDNAAFNAPFFYAMPVVSGAGWGWLASFVRRPPSHGGRAPIGPTA